VSTEQINSCDGVYEISQPIVMTLWQLGLLAVLEGELITEDSMEVRVAVGTLDQELLPTLPIQYIYSNHLSAVWKVSTMERLQACK